MNVAGAPEALLESLEPQYLPSFVSEWPAQTKWSTSYFEDSFGDASVRCWLQTRRGEVGNPVDMSMSEFLNQLKLQEIGSDRDIYCGNGSLAKVDPKLINDICNPFPDSGGGAGNLWMGKSGHQSHLHRDAHPGLLCGIAGRKTVDLWAPFDVEPSKNGPLNVYNDDLSILPSFRMRFVLNKGDAVLIPTYWWHLVTSRETDCVNYSISVNWFYTNVPNTVQLKYGKYWSILEKELFAILRSRQEKTSKWELMSERVLEEVFVRSLQGGVRTELLQEELKSKIVGVVQRFLSES